MSLITAKAEIANPPTLELSPIIMESAVLLSLAAVLVNYFV